MGFIQRMKMDKDYRIRIVLLAAIVLFVIGQTGPDKKEAQQSICNIANLESMILQAHQEELKNA